VFLLGTAVVHCNELVADSGEEDIETSVPKEEREAFQPLEQHDY
jgi:hypothetical protein